MNRFICFVFLASTIMSGILLIFKTHFIIALWLALGIGSSTTVLLALITDAIWSAKNFFSALSYELNRDHWV